MEIKRSVAIDHSHPYQYEKYSFDGTQEFRILLNHQPDHIFYIKLEVPYFNIKNHLIQEK